MIWVVLAVCCGGDSRSPSDDGNPCDPNPCKQAGKTQCEVVEKAAICTCDSGLAPDGRGGCGSTESWNASIVGNAISSSGATQYTAHLQVIDGDDKPIEGATLRVGNRIIKTDVEGRAPFTELEVAAPSFMKITADGYVAALRQLSIVNSGMSELVVKLVKQGSARKFKADERATLQAGSVSLSVGARAFVTELERIRVSGEVTARLTTFDAGATDPRAWPGSQQARSRSGQPTLVERWFTAVHAEFADANDKPLQLGPGSTATLAMALPSDANVAAGDEIGLWALDEQTGIWSLESSCTVSVSESGATKQKRCEGRVPHFSVWAAGTEWDIYKPGSLGCINVKLSVKLPDVNVANTQQIHVMNCDGDGCSPGTAWAQNTAWRYDEQVKYFSDSTTGQGALCGVTSAQSDLGVAVQLRVAHKAGATAGGLADGVYVHEAPRVVLESFKQKLGVEVLLNQTFEPAGDCEALCAQVVVEIDEEALKKLQRYEDKDGDGWVAMPMASVQDAGTDGAGLEPTDGGAAADAGAEPQAKPAPVVLGQLDCDDSDKRAYPQAWEPSCGGKDYNCDGRVPMGGQLTWQEVPDYWMWNHGICGTKCARAEDKEIAGNWYDEDCDGRVEDRDGDGFLDWQFDREPHDCNDSDASAHPGGTEVPSNPIDEDCDGYALDADGDGFFAWGHEGLALAQLGISTETNPDLFGDCDDGWSKVRPYQAVELEQGQLKSLFRPLGANNYARTEYFCTFFDDDGKPNWRFSNIAVDFNCDGLLTDLDGDGWTEPRDQSFGPAKAFDCNDYDPRIYPGIHFGPDGNPKCEMPKESELIDDAVCAIDGAALTKGCPPLALEGQSVRTGCYPVTSKVALCSFLGWETNGGPLKWKPGQAWGPCDGAAGDLHNDLADCPAGYMCAGGATPKFKYSDGLRTYLQNRYAEGRPLKYEGMCFKTCEPE